MSLTALRPWTEARFLAWLPTQDRRHELVDGQPRAMVGTTRRHNAIVLNLAGALRRALRGGRCEAFALDLAVRSAAGTLRYPDVVVDCAEASDSDRVAQAPTLLVEVLSPSTAAFDRTKKLDEYRALPTARHILLIDPDQPRMLLYTRGATDGWVGAEIVGLDASLDLPALGVALPVDAIYDGLTFPQTPPEANDAT